MLIAGAMIRTGMASPIPLALAAAWLVCAQTARAEDSAAFCADLERVAAGARERPPFASFPPPSEPMRLMGFGDCGIGMFGDSFVCVEDHPDSLKRFETLRSGIKACRPDAIEFRDPRLSPPRPDEHVVQLRLGKVWITLHEAGYANQPQRYVAMHVEPAPGRSRR
jgi:hypothetical protein